MCRLRTIFCKTVGNPRYIFSYFVNGDLEEMIDTLATQHMKMMSKTTTDALGTTAQIITEEILSTGTCEVSDLPAVPTEPQSDLPNISPAEDVQGVKGYTVVPIAIGDTFLSQS